LCGLCPCSSTRAKLCETKEGLVKVKRGLQDERKGDGYLKRSRMTRRGVQLLLRKGEVVQKCDLCRQHLQARKCYGSHCALCLNTYVSTLPVAFSKCQPQWHVTVSTSYVTSYLLEMPASVACDREYKLHKTDCLFRNNGSSYPT
jgi:hypothetical protein